MDPLAIIFDAISNLTGGLITDSVTLITGMVACGFIVMALDYLTTPIQNAWERRQEEVSYQQYKKKRKRADDWNLRYKLEGGPGRLEDK